MVNKLVMFIDDSPTVRTIVEISLQREFVSFPDGIEARRAVNNQLPGHLLQRECRLKEECDYTKGYEARKDHTQPKNLNCSRTRLYQRGKGTTNA